MPPTIGLPKGGGAIRGIGEKFTANPATGTGSFTVPIATSPGRSGFEPQLALAYDSGHGNGPFGLGWDLGLPAITRRTNLMLPRYRDADESDVFLLSGAEDLVPVLDPDRSWARVVYDDPQWAPGYRVDRYRPRVEGLFARIERWTAKSDGQMHWRSITRDNLTTLYGASINSRIADPRDPTRVFSWLICESYDDRGNAMVYDYKPENSDDIDPTLVFEAHRSTLDRSANRYLKRIRYGNRTPRAPGENLHDRTDWLFEVVFDYGEHDPTTPTPREAVPWLCRRDPFSSGRAGFDVRTYRLCQRVLMFHHFPHEADVGADCLVTSTDLTYASPAQDPEGRRRGQPAAAQLAAVTHRGHRRSDGSYVSRALPPVEFDYTPVAFHDHVAEVDPEGLTALPAGLATPGAQWVDLDGEGIAGALVEQAGAWTYEANAGGGQLGPATTLPSVSAGRTLGGGGGRTLVDLLGTGTLDVVDYRGPTPGFYARTDGTWAPFQAFSGLPTTAVTDPNVRMVDVTGDGRPDLLVTEADALTFYPSLGTDGFDRGYRVPLPTDEDRAPRVVFADPDHSILVGDFTGDGQPDLACVRAGKVCYWSGLGFGRFDAKVTMANPPSFDSIDGFDHRYLQLADVDGSGTTDLVYLGRGGARVWLNQAGNSFADPVPLRSVPPVDSTTAVSVTDLLGTGTPCLVWSSPLPAHQGHAMRYVDLMGGTKPYLLVGMRNNLGAETRVHYTSSTQFYLHDKAAGHPWLTRLPFPTFVVDQVTVSDRISGNQFTTTYRYRHGFYDTVEREFRGFGMVEQTDAEHLAAIDPATIAAASNLDPAHNVPPARTRTWFHTGAYTPKRGLSRLYQGDYWREPDPVTGGALDDAQAEAMLSPDTALPDTVQLPNGTRAPYQLSVPEAREAARALKGSVLRHEIFANDDTDAADRPYQVIERNYTLELLQPLTPGQRHAVCVAHPRETVTFDYERTLYTPPAGNGDHPGPDPRVTHEVTLEVDPYGNPLRSAATAYPRRYEYRGSELDQLPTTREAVHAAQAQLLVTGTETAYTNPIDDGTTYRAPQPADTRHYELIHLTPARRAPNLTNLFTADELRAGLVAAGDGRHDLPYDDVDHTGAANSAEPYRRLLNHSRTLYRADDLTGPLPLGALASRGLVQAHYTLAFTPGLLTAAFQRTRGGQTENLLPASNRPAVLGHDGGYLDGDQLFPGRDPAGQWWSPSGQVRYSPDPQDAPPVELAYADAHFFLPLRFIDPFGQTTTITYDYDLLVADSQDPVGNRTTVGARRTDGTLASGGQDYRVLRARLVSDPNRNQTAIAYDTLDMVVGTAIMGKVDGPVEGDTLEGFTADLDDSTIAAYLANPTASPQTLLGGATTRIVYDLGAYQRTATNAQPQPVVAAALARETHRADLPPGAQTRVLQTLVYSDGFGRDIQHKTLAAPGSLTDGGPNVDPRWVGSGWTIYNNKGQPVRQFEPFFTATPAFESDRKAGVSLVMFYDSLGRVVASYHPNDTYSKTMFDPWGQASWDVNDTVRLDPRTDPDVDRLMAAYLAILPPDQGTWYTQRATGGLGADEQDAAAKTALHAATPALAYHDPLARAVITVAHNRYTQPEAAGGSPVVVEERYPTRRILDIDGNHRTVIDPLGRSAAGSIFGPGRRMLKTTSADAGDTITVSDVTANPIRVFDSRGHTTRLTYDLARRLQRTHVASDTDPEVLRERIVYGDALNGLTTESANLRTRVYLHFDGAGVATTDRYDLDGNPAQTRRRLAINYEQQLDWSVIDTASDTQLATTLPGGLDEEDFTTTTSFDALKRVTITTTPDGSTTRTTYDQGGHVQTVAVRPPPGPGPAASGWTPYITDITYNPKHQREMVVTGNGVNTAYRYDPATFRLTRIITRRGAAAFPSDCPNPNTTPCGAQNLTYTYDPTGNITHLTDATQQTIFYNGAVADPSNDYTYDALYRLVTATGREHIGQQGAPPNPTWDDAPRTGLPHPQDGQAMQPYTERYTYDAVGNLQQITHHARTPQPTPARDWTRTYHYRELSALVAGETNNRLTGTEVGGAVESYRYDEHGNTIAMPHLPVMTWDDHNRFQHANHVGAADIYHIYDNAGIRVRKVRHQQTGDRHHERIYLGNYEIYREFSAAAPAKPSVERHTLHVMDGTRLVVLIETRTIGHNGPAQLVRYQYDNHLGSACLELDDHAAVVSYEEYYPYGSTAYQAVDSGIEVRKRYRYIGKERDEETGLYYYGARYYIPWLARWASPEEMVDPRTEPNSYLYTGGQPISRTDPDGRSWREFGAGLLVGAGTAILIAAAVAAAPITIPASIAVAAVAAGVTVTAATVVQSARQRDLLNRPISREQADFQAGSALGGLLVGAGSGPISNAMSSTARAASSLVPEFAGAGASVLAAPVAAAAPEVAGGVVATAAPVLMTAATGGGGGGHGGRTDERPSDERSSNAGERQAPDPASAPASGEPKPIKWTSYGGKHVAPKNVPWKTVIKSTVKGPAKYLPGLDVEALERLVWEKGEAVANGKPWKVMSFAEEVGASGGKSSSWVRVEESAGTLHGHPITETEFTRLTKKP